MAARSPRQFGLRALLGLTAVCAFVFGLCRWLALPPRTTLFVVAVLAVALVAALSLVVAIGRAAMHESDRDGL
ncbi:MAG TPA: hypothetical protein VFI31_23485 [Pirellulales bacterium]|nr:hypothetical protein [Pirellulales bacterium]